MTQPQPPSGHHVQIEINVPPEMEAGVFANFAGIWQDDASLVIDFAAVVAAPQPTQLEGGQSAVHVRAKVVSRVRIPPKQVIELMRGLGTQLDVWEKGHGPVAGPPQE
jgi:hypothetical protein